MAYTNDQIKNWWTTNKVGQGGLTDMQVADAMDKYGVNAAQLGEAVGLDVKSIQTRYDAARKPAAATPAVTPATVPPAPPAATKATTSPASLNAAVTTPAPTTPQVQTVDVNDPRNTVQGTINSVMSDSNLRQSADRNSAQAYNRLGLANTSMRVQGDQRTLYEAALPIAQADVTNRLQTQQFNAGQQSTATLTQLQGEEQRKNIAAETTGQSTLDAARSNANLILQTLQGRQQAELQSIVNKNNALVSNNQLAAASMNSRTQAIRSILENPDMTPEVKQQLIDKEVALFDQELTALQKLTSTDVTPILTGAAPQSSKAQAVVATAEALGTKELGKNDAALRTILDEAAATGTTTTDLFDAAAKVLPGLPLGQMLSYIQTQGYKLNADGTISK